MSDSESYEVGYRKPPKKFQFKKGTSGNPKGRPKGSLNVATIVENTLNEKVTINENGERKVVTKFQAAIKQLANKAAYGDLRAIDRALELARYSEDAIAARKALDARPLDDLTDEELTAIIRGYWPVKSSK